MRQKNQLQEIRQRVMDGEDFALLAEEFSEDPGSAKIGGDLGWIGLGVFTPTFEETMLNTEIGSISEVFESEFGYHFLEVLEKEIMNLPTNSLRIEHMECYMQENLMKNLRIH